ncbi:MAG: DUF1800 family protein [Solirubrobacteraceae bacterium]|nr:DUF1800 family protein [Solirubrobacteraceae bacterium]
MSPAVLTDPLQAPAEAARLRMTPPADAAERLAAATKKKKKRKPKKLPVCTAKDLRQQRAWDRNQRLKKSKRKKLTKPRKCRVVPVVPTPTRPSPTGPVAAPPVTTPSPDAFPTAPVAERTDGLRAYSGPFGVKEATRLLFRGGFGPKPGQAQEFAGLGLKAAVARLINPGGATLQGPAPAGDFLVGGQFAPEDRWGHGHLEWLDRTVRSTDQLGERMTLVMHDWIAISDAGVGARQMRTSIQLLRDGWRGSFRELMMKITVDPAMLEWLNGLGSDKWSPNENYARELMELFCLGADRGAYTEADIREMARALTGWRADWSEELGLHNYRFDARRWDEKEKVFFRGQPYERRGKFNWQDTVNAVLDHPLHASFVALKLWGAFIPTPPTPVTLDELVALYRSSGERLEPLVEAILQHPDLYNGPSVTKAPITYVAGMLRARGRGIDDDSWTWICSGAGQQLWSPPNVSGWNERAWLNTTTYSYRWYAASNHVHAEEIDEDSYRGSTETPQQAVERALAFWGNPVITAEHRAALDGLAVDADATPYWNGGEHVRRTHRQHALRMLVVVSPDYQVS